MTINYRTIKSEMSDSTARVAWFTDSPLQDRIVLETEAFNKETRTREFMTQSLSLEEALQLASALHRAVMSRDRETRKDAQ